jgi:hypothetical protein
VTQSLGTISFFDARQGVAAVEWNEAAFGCEAAVKPGTSVFQIHREYRFYEDSVLGRCLVALDSCYGSGLAREGGGTDTK